MSTYLIPELQTDEERRDMAFAFQGRVLGGPGSGNFGHKGRPGEVGGSAPDAGGTGGDTDERTPGEALTDLTRALTADLPRGTTFGDNDDEHDEVRSEIKHSIAADLGRRLESDVRMQNYLGDKGDLAASVLNKWASTSGDSEPLAVGFQLAVAEEFGLEAETSHFDPKVLETAKHYGSLPEGTRYRGADPVTQNTANRAVARAMYDSTQEWFAARGITHVVLARGVDLTPAEEKGFQYTERDTNPSSRRSQVRLQAASSFTSNMKTAGDFGDSDDGAIHLIRVPVSKILATSRTGVGCIAEYEVVVLGGTHKGYTFRSFTDYKVGVSDRFKKGLLSTFLKSGRF